MSYRAQIPVRFGDVDHAGIVYYPQFFIYFHEAFEDFFNDSGFAYNRMLDELRIGFPTVHIDCDYKAPLKYGDSLDIEMSVVELGKASAKFRYQGYRHRDGQLAVRAEITCVCVDLDKFVSVPFPDDLRKLFEGIR